MDTEAPRPFGSFVSTDSALAASQGIIGQPGLSCERSTQVQFTPSASPFLRPLQMLGLDSPSASPKMGQKLLSIAPSYEPQGTERGFFDAAGARPHEPSSFGKRRDSSATVTHHNFSRTHLHTVLPEVKSESTPTSPMLHYFGNVPHGGQSASPPPSLGLGAASSYPPSSTSSSCLPSPVLHSQSLPHTPQHLQRGHSPPHHHLAHSVRMAFSMTPITEPGTPHTYSDASAHHALSSSSSSVYNTQARAFHHLPFSHPSSRAGSPPIMLPPLSNSTGNSTTTTMSSRVPSPAGLITLPPLKTHAGLGDPIATEPRDAEGGDDPTPAGHGERVTLPGFSEIIRAAEP